jgi:predicted dehydrogenase
VKKLVKLAVIGIGYWGPNLVRNFSKIPEASIEYLCDLNPESIDSVAYLVPQAKKTDSIEEVLESNVDAVVIASPAVTHYEITKKALTSGKHVFVEKPLALKVSEAEEMVRIAEEKRLILMVGHLMLYHPAVNYLKQLVDAGELGEIYYLYSQRLNLGRLRKDENVVWSLAPHDISMVFYLKNSKPVAVSCIGGDYLRDGIEDVAFIDILFEDGSIAHIHVSWLDPHKTRKLTLVGSKKMAVFDDMESSEKIKIFDKGVTSAPQFAQYGEEIALRFGDIVIPYLKMQEPLYLECKHFINCILEGKQPVSDGRNGLEVVRILEACDRSLSQGGQPVSLS